jgi:hypothetical protein
VAWGSTGSSGLRQWTSHLSRLHISATHEWSADVLAILRAIRLRWFPAHPLIVQVYIIDSAYCKLPQNHDNRRRHCEISGLTRRWLWRILFSRYAELETNRCNAVESGISLQILLLPSTVYFSNLKIKSVGFCETSIQFYQSHPRS